MSEAPPHLAVVNDESATPPHSNEAEVAVLGAALLSEDARSEALRSGLQSDDFYAPKHREIFEAVAALDRASQPVDLVTVAEELRRRGELSRTGGVGQLMALIDATPTTVNTRRYVEIVKDHAAKRALLLAAGDAHRMAKEGATSRAILADIEDATAQIRLRQPSARATERAGDLVASVHDRCERGEQVAHVPTGLSTLDAKIRGFTAGALSIVAGRPGMGKTIFALTVAINAAEHGPVMFFSIELQAREIADRLAASIGDVDLRAILDGRLSDDDWQRQMSGLARCEAAMANLRVLDGQKSVAQIISDVKFEIAAGRPPSLIVVDHIGLVVPRDRRTNRWEEASQTSRDLKYFAAESGAAVVALCQINRELENTKSRRPTIANLRESGSHEQDADLILLLYRDAYYAPDADPTDAEVIIGKSRSGSTGKVDLAFAGRFAKFTDPPQASFRWMSKES